ncbi:MAG: glucuronate isomerase [Firmicutes bacterium]|nr:glucuronate isomerase [Bacillota bacterium]
MTQPITRENLFRTVEQVVRDAKVTDVHTHLYAPIFGDILLWGFDELVTYHYLIAETMRWVDISYDEYWKMTKVEQADLIWKTLFLDNSPYSEACRGVLTTLQRLGLDASSRDVGPYREFFAGKQLEDYVDQVFDVANLECVVMTNDPFDPKERSVWLEKIKKAGEKVDPRFRAALRLDMLLINWDQSWHQLKEWGFDVTPDLNDRTVEEVQRFLREWIELMNPVYMAVSLPYDFELPEKSARAELIEKCIVPVSRETNVPFALMVGVKRQLNPGLRDAGDGVGKMNIASIDYLCSKYPHNKFLVTLLARENQHELAVLARKFRNLMPFGCWWFLNNPSLIEEITKMRLELLGTSVILQHSDARVLDQLIYKWEHSRRIITQVLVEKYQDLMATGWVLTEAEIRRDVDKLMGGNLWSFLEREFN